MQMTERVQKNAMGPCGCEPALRPRTDIAEYGDRYEIEMELPGVTPDRVDLQIEDDELRVAAERTAPPAEENGQRILVRERRAGTFVRVFTLGNAIDRERIEGKMTDGVLRIRLPKSAAALPRKIQIHG